MAEQPNIILIMCDQLRAFEVGCYGNAVIRTPNMDRLAAEGVRFETAITNFPVCMAARSVMLSGQYNRTCTGGVGNVNIPGANEGGNNMPEYPSAGRPHLPAQTVAELLRSGGYHTSVIGKWHIHSWPNDIGFDHWLIPRVHHAHTGQLFTENGGPEFSPPGFSVEYEAERVESFLRQPHDAPFFLFYSISPPHCPMSDAPEKYLSMYDPRSIPLRPNVDASKRLKDQDHWFKVYRWDYRYYNLHLPYTEDLPPEYDLRRCIADYYGLTTWVDDCLGRVLAALDDTGLAENTVIIFTSDHGDNLGSHGLVQKGGPNEESIRIPLIMRGPDACMRGKAARNDVVASLVDIAPTVLARSGISIPGHFHGQDLFSPRDEHAIVETGGGAGVRTLQHLYYVPFAEKRVLSGKPQSIFDMEHDPYQTHNLASEHDDMRSLDGILRQWDVRVPWMS
ncbi:MAG: sulfatase-like hydrolase/transferase [Spirochaetes bacterium]|nr:sulfatase-like hydrolase/transferase [Spirochaetota bacterium]